MSGIFATAGATVDIGNPLAAKSAPFIAADFNGQSWVNIGWLNTIGAFGDQASEITFDLISEERTAKLKGTRNAGNLELVCGADTNDDGQVALRAAEEEIFDYAFRVTFNDARPGFQPSKRYFIGKVMQAREVLDSANNVVRLNATVGINSNIVRVDAT
jgi:hypothetical protein